MSCFLRRLFASLVPAWGLVLAWGLVPSPSHAADKIVVLTALESLYSITSSLAQSTSIEVRSVPANLPGFAQVPRAFTRLSAQAGRDLEQADAVISLRSLWPEDPLYREARARNIRVVEIDAGRSLAKGSPSVMVITQPFTQVPWRKAPVTSTSKASPYAWFSPSNGIRMADLIARDLKRLAPQEAERIDANLKTFSAQVQALRAEFEARILALEDPRVFALSDHFVYLTNEFGIEVSGSFLEEDVLWTQADRDGFIAMVKAQGIKTILHHWQPSSEVEATIGQSGGRLLVLDDGENSIGDGAPDKPDSQAYLKVLRAALEDLVRALAGQ